jgi:hypothetical protein
VVRKSGKLWNFAARMMWYSVNWFVPADTSADRPNDRDVVARAQQDGPASLGENVRRVMSEMVWMYNTIRPYNYINDTD